MRPFLLLLLLASARLRAQWAPVSSGTDAEFRGLGVPSRRVVWASGTKGRVARSVDGGRTWRVDTVSGAAALDLRAVHAAGATTAWALSAGPAEAGQARIFGTTDGGRTWTLRYATELRGAFLDALAFWDARHGIALGDPVGGKLFLLVTGDAGATWTRVPAGGLPPVLPDEAFFAASGECLVVGGRGDVWLGTGGGARARVFHSRDRGRTWRVADTPVRAGNRSSGIFALAFRDASHGVAVGGDYARPGEATPNVAVTSDGGRTWRAARGPLPAGYMSGVSYVPGSGGPGTYVAVGLGGTARSTDGGESWRMVDTVAYNSVRFASARDGWAVGPKGRIARWEGSAQHAGEDRRPGAVTTDRRPR